MKKRKFKLDRNLSNRISALAAAGMIFVSALAITGCSKKEDSSANTAIVSIQNSNDETQRGIKNLFPTMNDEIVKNSSLIILLDEIAKEDENGKISSEVISQFKSKIDVENMMGDFSSFLDVLEQTMIENKKVLVTSNLVIDNDEEILAKIETITENIITGKDVKTNFDLIYTLFVEEDEVTYDGLKFEIRDLSYAGRAIANMYARTCAYFSKESITKTQYEKIDARTDNQNSKAYIKTKLEILNNGMIEKSEVDVTNLFNNEYDEAKTLTNGKVNIGDEDIKNLVNYMNLEYLDSDRVATKDKNAILGEYTDEKVSNVLVTIDAITKYNANNKSNLILLSNMLVDNYKETSTGKIDKVVLDYIEFNSVMLLNTTTKESTKEEIFNNPYFKNIYSYLRKSNFTHKYSEENVVDINYQDISDGVKFVCNQIVYYTLNERSNIFKYTGYEEKVNLNLEESIQYIQNTITGECEKVEAKEFIKK